MGDGPVQEPLTEAPEETLAERQARLDREAAVARERIATLERQRAAGPATKKLRLCREASALRREVLEAYPAIGAEPSKLKFLDAMCTALHLKREAERDLATRGQLVRGTKGRLELNPSVMAIKHWDEMYARNEKALCLDWEPLRDGPGRPSGS